MMDISNHDNNRGYRSPRAWAHLKRTLRQLANGLPQLAIDLEQAAEKDGACVRLMLAAALNLFTKLGSDNRRAALVAMLAKTDPSTAIAQAPPTTVLQTKRHNIQDPAEAWKEDHHTVAPSEDLPEEERATAAELLAAGWKLLAPGWPIPPLPADARLYECGDEPLLITSGTGRTLRSHCPVCGKAYQSNPPLHRHLIKCHRWPTTPEGKIDFPAAG